MTSRLQPVRWRAPRAPKRARQLSGDHLLDPVERLELPGSGPEDVVLDAEGRLLAGLEDGRILRVSRDGRLIETLAETGGRPLGLEALPGGGLLICDDRRGLLRLDSDGRLETLVDTVDGESLTFASNVVATRDGAIYFTVSSRRYRLDEYRQDLLEHSGTGRLLRRDPSGTVEVLLDDLQFANGVALAEDESFLVFAETAAYRLSRYDLTGPHRGRWTVLADNLPGFPDNISRSPRGFTWVTLASPRDPILDFLLRRPPALRRLLARIPEERQPGPKRTAWVLGIDDDGRIRHDLQAPGSTYSFVTGVVEAGSRLYLGSLTERAIGVLPLP